MNDASKKRNFVAENERALAKQRIISQGKIEPLNNPTNFVSNGNLFGGGEKSIPDLLHDDLSKRQKVPLADGVSQYSFMKIAEKGPEQGARIELQAYTLEEVSLEQGSEYNLK